MITTNKILPIYENEISDFGWPQLRRLKNTYLTQSIITKIHNIEDRHKGNVKKQSNQIRHCLIQADEYFNSAKNSSDSIKPLLMYYGTLSLCLSMILLKGDGNTSLDRAREQNAHHGLQLSIDQSMIASENAKDKLRALSARQPEFSKKQYRGTFELWHKTAREQPLGAKSVTTLDNGSQETGITFATPSDRRFQRLKKGGRDLLWCFENTVGMQGVLYRYDCASTLVKVNYEIKKDHGDTAAQSSMIFQPTTKALLEKCILKFKFHPEAVNALNISEYENGIVLNYSHSKEFTTNSSYPPAFQSHLKEIFFCTDNDELNEFGIFYLGLYILGNYCRYYPEMWMRDLEDHSDLYHLASKFLQLASERIPILVSSEFLGYLPVIRNY